MKLYEKNKISSLFAMGRTPRCNQNCIHCYNYWRSGDEIMSESKLYGEICSKIIDLHPVSVVITGGEPLLVFDQIKPQIVRLLNNNISVSINTNAVLVNDEIVSFLKQNRIPVLVSLPCSEEKICDKITNVSESFINISAGIKKLRDANVSVTVNMVVMKTNIDYIYNTAKYCVERLNVRSFFASRVGKPINARDYFDEELLTLDDLNKMEVALLKVKNDFKIRIGTAGPIPACSFENNEAFQEFAYRKGCSAGKTTYSIDSNGNIKACPRDNKIYGNILEDNFSDVWDKMVEWRDESLLPSECKLCSKKIKCGGGCRLDALPFTKKRNSLDTMCNVDNLPIKFEKINFNNSYSIHDVIFVPNTLIFIEEEFGWRVSNFGKTLYITKEMKDFLEHNKKFTIGLFSEKNNIDINVATNIISVLLKNNILYNDEVYNRIDEEVKN